MSRKDKAVRATRAVETPSNKVKKSAFEPYVDLMPPSEIESRARIALVWRWVWAVLFTMLAAGGIVAAAMYYNENARIDMEKTQNQGFDLLAQIGDLSHVNEVQSDSRNLTNFRQMAMSNHQSFAATIAEIERHLPENSQIVGIRLITGGTLTEQPEKEIGLGILLTVHSATPMDIVELTRSLRTLSWVTLSEGTELLTTTEELSDDFYRYSLQIALNQTIYSKRFVSTEGD